MVEQARALWQTLRPCDYPPLISAQAHLYSLVIKRLHGFGESLSNLYAGGVFLAEVAKLVYALDLGSSAARRESSSLSFRTNIQAGLTR